jgi:hypothetical protein
MKALGSPHAKAAETVPVNQRSGNALGDTVSNLPRTPAQVGTENRNRQDEQRSDDTFGDGIAGEPERQRQRLRGAVLRLMRGRQRRLRDEARSDADGESPQPRPIPQDR